MEHDLNEILDMSPMEDAQFQKEKTIYSIIMQIEYLEKAYFLKNIIDGIKYDVEIKKLLHQFKNCQEQMINFEGIDSFFKTYDLEYCNSAKTRIISGKSGYDGNEAGKGMQ